MFPALTMPQATGTFDSISLQQIFHISMA